MVWHGYNLSIEVQLLLFICQLGIKISEIPMDTSILHHRLLCALSTFLLNTVEIPMKTFNSFQVVNDPKYKAPGNSKNREELQERTARATETVHEICMGLHAIHKNGFLHRDLKLENIMVGVIYLWIHFFHFYLYTCLFNVLFISVSQWRGFSAIFEFIPLNRSSIH